MIIMASVVKEKHEAVEWEYKTVNLRLQWKFSLKSLSSQAIELIEKMTNNDWKLVSQTHDMFGNPAVLTFCRKGKH